MLWKHAVKQCLYIMYSLSSQRPLNVNGNDVKEQHDEITPLSHTAL